MRSFTSWAGSVDRTPPPSRARSGRPALRLTRVALVTATMIALSFVPLPLPLGPTLPTLQNLGVMMAAVVLSPGEAVAALGIHLLLGLTGLPVLGGGAGGPTLLLSPAGAYLWGYLPGVALAARLAGRWRRAGRLTPVRLYATAVSALAPGYLVEVVVLRVWASASWRTALLMGVLGLLPLDLLKAGLLVAPAQAILSVLPGSREL